MRAALLGWLVFLLALVGGYVAGRRRLSAPPPRVEAARAGTEALPAPPAAPPAADLPSDFRRPESLPQTLR